MAGLVLRQSSEDPRQLTNDGKPCRLSDAALEELDALTGRYRTQVARLSSRPQDDALRMIGQQLYTWLERHTGWAATLARGHARGQA